MTDDHLEDQVRRVFERQGAALDATPLASSVNVTSDPIVVEGDATSSWQPRGLFLAVAAVAVVAFAGMITMVGQTRETDTAAGLQYPNSMTQSGTGPIAMTDHWHHAYLVNHCGYDLGTTQMYDSADGIHTHGDGLVHIHPFTDAASEQNATLGLYFESQGAVLTDDSFTTGDFDGFSVSMSEAEGCNGEAAVLQLAIWTDPFDPDSDPIIHTENLANVYFDVDGAAVTLALLPVGEEIPRPPEERLRQLETSSG